MKSLLLVHVVSWTTITTLFLLQYVTLNIQGFSFSVAPTNTHVHKYKRVSTTFTFIEARNRPYQSLAGSTSNDESTSNDADDNTSYDIEPSFSYADDPSSALTTSSPVYYTEEDETDCLPPGRTPETKMVMLISDSTGQTVKSAFGKTLAQFETCDNPNLYLNSPSYHDDDVNNNSVGDCNVQTRQFTFIRREAALASIIKKAAEKKRTRHVHIRRHGATTPCRKNVPALQRPRRRPARSDALRALGPPREEPDRTRGRITGDEEGG